MAKKKPEEQVEFIKFIKKLYTEDVQLNFDEYFILNVIDNEIYLIFPEDKFYRLYGKLDITDAEHFKDWLLKSNCSVKIYNNKLDALRKLKLGYFKSIGYTDNEYKINLDPESEMEFSLIKEDPIDLDLEYNYKYSHEIPSEKITENSLLVISIDENNEFKFGDSCNEDHILFDSAIKNFKFIFKKDAKYTFYATEKDNEGFRIIMFEGQGKFCTLRQYFKVI